MSNELGTKYKGMIGMAMRAGKLVVGLNEVCDNMARRGQIIIALFASDASANTKKRIKDKCTYYDVELTALPFTCAELGACIGKSGLIAAVGVTDNNFAKAIRKINS